LAFAAESKFNCIALDHGSPLTLDVVPPDAATLIDSLDAKLHKKKKPVTKGKKTTKKISKSKSEKSTDEKASDAPKVHVSHKIAVVIGNETTGVSKELTAAAVANIAIPSRVPSLNVSVSAGILFNHLFGQRDAAERRLIDGDEVL
jgi:tRNA(Leu) C34 or U34 (ribose-2'-O)-methylase TrmL